MENLILFVILLITGYFSGTYIEKKHYKSLDEREKNLPKIPVISFDKNNFNHDVSEIKYISGSVVIGADYFKTILSGLVSFFGGNISVLESVLQRARREAVIRAKQQATGADFIANMRYETTEVSQQSKRSAPKVEVYVYATAIYLNKNAISAPAA